MKFTAKLQDAMNEQMRREFNAYYLYLAMSAWLDHRNYNGFARWMRMQAQEEANHAMKFFDFIDDRGGVIVLEAIDQPKAEWKSVLAVFEAAKQHEQKVSEGIYTLYELAMSEKDWASQAMLQWFITEQVEEEKTGTEIVDTLRIIGEDGSGLIVYDRELGSRNRAE